MRSTMRAFVAFSLILFGFSSTIFWHVTKLPPVPPGPTYKLYGSGGRLPQSDYAVATFLTGQGTNDAYFVATRVIAHSLLHADNTKLNDSIPFLVLCSESTPNSQKDRLVKDGATVLEVRDVPVNWWIHSGVRRWKEQFTKLRVFEITEYKRILFMDADTMIMKPMDDIFKEAEVKEMAPVLRNREGQIKKDEAELPDNWFFASRSDNGLAGQRDHPTPPFQTSKFSAGFFMVAPDAQIFAHLASVMTHYRRFDPFTMEQSLLNYVFRRDGPMPWIELNWKWGSTWPNEKDAEMGVYTLHEKLWDVGPQALGDMWRKKKAEMLHYSEEH